MECDRWRWKVETAEQRKERQASDAAAKRTAASIPRLRNDAKHCQRSAGIRFVNGVRGAPSRWLLMLEHFTVFFNTWRCGNGFDEVMNCT